MHRSIHAFIDHLRTERHASVHTVRSYEDDLELYSGYLVEVQGEEADPSAVDPVRLRRYSAWLASRGYAPSTVARRLASLRSFFRYLRREGLVPADPAAGLRNPKQPKRLPRLLRVDEVIRLLEAVPVETTAGVRDRAMLETLYGGGLRVSELVGLNVDDLDAESDLVRVRGKGRRERLCPVGGDGRRVAAPLDFLTTAQGSAGARAVLEPTRDSPDDPERRPAPGGPPRAGRAGRYRQSPHSAPQLRDPPAGRWGRPPQRPGTAWTPQFDHHANLHPRHTRPDSRYLS